MPRINPDKDCILVVYARSASGPGWGNLPLWVVVANELNELREECIQPDEQTDAMRLLYRSSEAINNEMRQEVRRALGMKKDRY